MNQHKIKKHHIEQLNGNTSTITLTSVKGVREKVAVLIDSSPPVNILVDAIDQMRKPGGTIGPVLSPVLPLLMILVSGPNAEFSGDTHELLQVMADSKAQYQCRSQGLESGEVRVGGGSSPSTQSDRWSTPCSGPGREARLAAQRRALAMSQQERRSKERADHWLLHTRGHRVLHHHHEDTHDLYFIYQHLHHRCCELPLPTESSNYPNRPDVH